MNALVCRHVETHTNVKLTAIGKKHTGQSEFSTKTNVSQKMVENTYVNKKHHEGKITCRLKTHMYK